MQLSEEVFDATNVILPYLFSQPALADGVQQAAPLILFLHGAGERGTLESVRQYGVPRAAAARRDFPFFTLSPLCPRHTYWEDLDSVLFALLDDILARYPVDPRRVYLTGLSMGGHGTWVLGLQQPARFAALAPVCPPFPNLPGVMAHLEGLKDMPVWVFHGAKDDVVPPEHSRRMVAALRKLNPQVRYTLYPNARHDCWKQVYAGRKLYDWFLEQRSGCSGCSG